MERVIAISGASLFVGVIWYLFHADNGAYVVWTFFMPFIPLVILAAGFYRWRRYCPLAWFASLGQAVKWPFKRRMPYWLEQNYYRVQFALIFAALYVRHLLVNFDNTALAYFFIGLIAVAVVTNMLFVGKSWCNYLCPVGMVEKIYSGSFSGRTRNNSACSRCEGCKKHCPDIDMESSYWKDKRSSDKRAAFFAFPGLVLGFYLFYYFQSGGWDYYFSGQWALQVYKTRYGVLGLHDALTAFAVLALCSLASYFFFILLEKLLPKLEWFIRKDTLARSHIMLILAAFAAFNLFYLFAGAPTFDKFTAADKALHFSVIMLSTIFMWKEIHREERFFLHERFADQVMKRYGSLHGEAANLKEIYYAFAHSNENRHEKLGIYKESLVALLHEGIFTAKDIDMLDKMRGQLSISKAEHQKVLRDIEREHSELFVLSQYSSSEKRHQLQWYRQFLLNELEKIHTLHIDEVEYMCRQSDITPEEHKKIAEEVMKDNEELIEKTLSELDGMTRLANLLYRLPRSKDKAYDFLVLNLHEAFEQGVERVGSLLQYAVLDDLAKAKKVPTRLKQLVSEKGDTAMFNGLVEEFSRYRHELFTIHLLLSEAPYDDFEEGLVDEMNVLLQSDNTRLVAALLFYIKAHGLNGKYVFDLDEILESDNPVMTEVLSETLSPGHMSIVEMAASVHKVSLFSSLSTEELFELVPSVRYKHYDEGQTVIAQGERPDALYMIVAGNAEVYRVDEQGIVMLERLETGDYFGEIDIIAHSMRAASVRAMGDLQLLVLDSGVFETLVTRQPAVGLSMMKTVTQRLLGRIAV